ncbi:hypothetical protein [Streptomyces sparsogenes]|uniref:hypothetical protein n=1 Tax=Streptomyces sparsogenes TaxID=67365 RepID=UPI00114C9399|nr:hypothetical protein [Streptomyces sparsogenes]
MSAIRGGLRGWWGWRRGEERGRTRLAVVCGGGRARAEAAAQLMRRTGGRSAAQLVPRTGGRAAVVAAA